MGASFGPRPLCPRGKSPLTYFVGGTEVSKAGLDTYESGKNSCSCHVRHYFSCYVSLLTTRTALSNLCYADTRLLRDSGLRRTGRDTFLARHKVLLQVNLMDVEGGSSTADITWL